MVRRLFAVAIVLAAFACGTTTHIYEGRAYLDKRDCLGTTSSVDVVEGDPPGKCAPICLSQGHADASRTLYVSAMCAPYPFMFDAAGTDPGCAPALAAFGRDDTCNVDGTSTHPIPDAATE